MIRMDGTLDEDSLDAVIDQLSGDTTRTLQQLCEMIAIQTIAYLRSLTSEMRPPARAGGSPREAHPGHWADVTGALANAYGYSVEIGDDYGQITFTNSMEYAQYLEVRDGYFVLSGILEPGGPVDAALRRALAAIAPDWEIVE